HAKRHNATVGMAFHRAEPMYLSAIRDLLPELKPDEIFSYSTTAGEPVLRRLWQQEMKQKNPLLEGTTTSLPLVVAGLTHGIATAADLFVEQDDPVVIPDMFWGNYRLIFELRRQARIETFPFFAEDGSLNCNGSLNCQGLKDRILQVSRAGKAVVLLNFPNNPTGYSPTQQEAEELIQIFGELAERGIKLLVITDDAYFGLFYEKETYKQSLFSSLASLHPNIVAVKVDGCTKEDMTWGFRIGFLTFGSKGLGSEHYTALEKKTMGLIRSSISNASRPAQSLLIRGLQSKTYRHEKTEAFKLMEQKYLKVKEILGRSAIPSSMRALPYNSGYFMCFKMLKGKAESLRQTLLYSEGIGTIAIGEEYLRVAYSIPDLEELEDIYSTIFRTAEKLTGA
ncbi:MAG TPA: aminotransferase class I/II-fold pyridoxal phosphate-dependent enzyme, partial [Spirochaetia bacterium]|nr:aminotransferase class I/II-fold pyridoxal phosphate-dependent enzyme [Spirochaetia bacterium]